MQLVEGVNFISAEFIDRYLCSEQDVTHRFSHSASYPLAQNLVWGADFIVEHPLQTLLFTWSLSALTVGAGISALIGMAAGIVVPSVMYRWARGPKMLNPIAYENYLKQLDDFPAAIEHWGAVTWPTSSEDETLFFEYHSKQIEYLAERHRWEHITNMMASIRQRFPVDGAKGHLSLRLMTYVYKRHAYSKTLHTSDKHIILNRFLKHWLRQNSRKQPSLSTGLECASVLRPLYRMDMIEVGCRNSINSTIFSSLSDVEQQVIIDHLLAGDRRCLFVLVSLCAGDEEFHESPLIHSILKKCMQAQSTEPDHLESGRKMAQLIISRLIDQETWNVSPEVAAWLCHLYAADNNIMRGLMRLYDDFPDVVKEQRNALAQHMVSRALTHIQLTRMTTDEKHVYLIGPSRDPKNFVSELFGEEVSNVNTTQSSEESVAFRDPENNVFEISFGVKVLLENVTKKNHYYYSLFSDFMSMVSKDSFGGADTNDGVRGSIFQFIFQAIADLSENEFLFRVSRDIGRNITFFLLRSLLSAEEMDHETKVIYFFKTMEAYQILKNADSLFSLISSFKDVADSYQIKDGCVDLISDSIALLVVSNHPGAKKFLLDLFDHFFKACPVDQVSQNLPMLKSILPINNPQGPFQLYEALGANDMPDQLRPAIIAMLIFVLHPPEHFAKHSVGIFNKKPFVFTQETQEILRTFGRSIDLEDDGNHDICQMLAQIGFQEQWLDQLKETTRTSETFVFDV